MTSSSKPWWREPWPWLLMAGPLAALVACAVTITLALNGYARERLDDGGRKQGLVVSKPAASAAPNTDPSEADPPPGD